ncbi:hypothetical protein BDV12DRAFT_194747 [Aspergillus spectabilis]
MVKVAVAGGSQGLGSAIVAGIEARGIDECFILSRTARQDDHRYLAVDYTSIDNIRDMLEQNNIDTVISALAMENGGGEAQLNLSEGAELSGSTRRFMPSEFGIVYLENSKTLEHARFSNGQFLDYITAPRVPTPLAFAPPIWLDLQNNFAVIPGDGTAPVVVTHTSDVGHYVAALLGLPQWEKRYHLIGDRCSIGEMARIAEEVKGVEFEKHFETRETLVSGQRRMPPVHKEVLPGGLEEALMPFLAASGVMTIDGEMDLGLDAGGGATNVNGLFPELRTRTVREALGIWVKSG